MFLGDEDLVISKNNQNGNTHKIKKKRYKQLLYKLEFTGEEIGISSKTELEIPIPYSKHSVTERYRCSSRLPQK